MPIIEISSVADGAMHIQDRGRPGLTVDLNSDLGEGFGAWTFGDDTAMLEIVSSANIACGFHAGDPRHIGQTCSAATSHDVVIGAQVSYRDLAGFGRRYMDIEAADLTADIVYQIGALAGLARTTGGQVRYVKPHGALYNAIATQQTQAEAVVAAVLAFDCQLAVLGLPGSAFLAAAQQSGLPTFHEGFADRAYTPAGHLVPRREPGAVLHDADLIADRVLQMVTEKTVEAIDGSTISMDLASICIHGDTPGAVEIARTVRARLESAGVTITSFLGR